MFLFLLSGFCSDCLCFLCALLSAFVCLSRLCFPFCCSCLCACFCVVLLVRFAFASFLFVFCALSLRVSRLYCMFVLCSCLLLVVFDSCCLHGFHVFVVCIACCDPLLICCAFLCWFCYLS